MRRFLISFAILATLITGAYFALPTEVFAQVETGLEAVGDVVKLPDTDPIIIATRIINISLGFLGIIMVSLMVYAGFLWMTSGGEATKVDKAKKIITSAVIGSVIILSSWAITRFILERLIDAASGPSGVPGAPPPPGGGFGGPGSTQVFQVKSITPQGDVSIRNVQVKLLFSRPVDENTATAIVITNGDNTTVGGTLAVNESLVTFTPSDPCPEPNQDLKCFDGDSDYTVSVQDTLRSTQNQAIVCGGFSPSCTANFHTGNLVDTRDPMVNMNAPIDGQGVPADELVALMAQAEDDSGVAYVEFLDGVELVDQSAPNEEQTPLSFLAEGLWDTAGAELQSVHQLFAKAYDIDDHEKQSSAVSVIVRPPSCFNEVQDGEETGIDCGGTPNTSGYCGACEGNSCTSDQQCSSGVCADGICVDKPIISSVGPLDGRPGTFVTIKGVNFGSSGFVVFVGGPDAIDDKVASVPQVCQQLGGKMWTKTQVIVEVPEGAVTGPIQLQNGASQLSDRTDDERGPIIQDFMVSDQTYPGLCGLDPDQGFVGGKFTAIGQGFGQSPSTMNFGKLALNQFSSWSDAQVVANIPVAGAGNHAVKIVVDNIESNPADFEIISKAKAGPPQIFSLDPERGPRGEYVTLSGKNFGYSVGTVRFKNKLSREEALADVSFPAACAEGFWTETSVIVKVPQSFLNAQSVSVGDYTIRLIRADNVETNEMDFSINDQAAKPGICAISPNVGPIGTEVTMAGERFGTDTGDITFSENKAGISASWKNNEIKTEVSAGAITGPVIITAQGVKSNPAFFQVRNCNEQPGICSKDEQCCGNGSCVPAEQGCPSVSLSAMFAWQSSTGFIPVAPRVVEECKPDAKQPPVPSPSPWDGRSKGNQVCVNATINARFTTHLDETTVTGSNFKFSKCTGKEDDPCQSTEPVELSGGFPLLQAASQDQDLVTLEAKAGLEQDTTYSVEILTGVKGKGIAGANMDESPRCESGVAYCFTFKTRNLPDPCQLGGVIVSPHPYELNDAGVKVAYLASPLAAEDKCIVLNAQAYEPWGWDHSNNNAIYDTPLKENPETGQVWHKQIGIAVSETGDTPVLMSSIAKGIKGVAELYIRFIPPRVDAFAPNCQKACINALIWARFNTAIDPASITDNVEVRPCANENCIVSELSQALPIPKVKINVTVVPKSADEEEGKILRFLRIEPVDTNGQILLLPGKFYRVLLRGGDEQGIRGMHGVPMTGLNDPEGFIWTFRTKLGENAYCGAQSVDVSPLEKIETVVGARQMFQATPFGAPDECSMLGQALVQTESAVWDSSDKLVADFFEGGKLDTGGTLPARCNSMCLATGAQAEFGKVAVCGNSIIETTNPAYCTEYLKKWPGLCSVLPNGAKAGEECDPGIPSNKGQCDELTCLWKPVTQVPNGTCGNDKWDEFGEECDFGSICMGAAPTSTTPDGTICTSLQVRATCEANKGTCAPRQIRGCSPFCRKTGSRSGDSTCGNSDVADGEDCDDGNVANGDGCSSNCLHEGSSAVIASVCGNAILEPGETCEKPNLNNLFPAGCDQIRCLHIGSALCDNDPKTPNVNCCGNANIDAGEDCDDGNKTSGDGCGVSCLLEGSSVAYPNPSYCSDGVLETGEQCEVSLPSSHNVLQNSPNNAVPQPPKGSPAGDKLVDSAQLAEIIGNTDPDEDGLMKSNISAELLVQTGNATYGLQCGFTSEQSCSQGFGLTDQGCCNVRPTLGSSYPSGDNVCRNVQIKATFNTDIDRNSLANSVQLVKEVGDDKCPDGTTQVAEDFRPIKKGIKAWIERVWHRVAEWWSGSPAIAQVWCMGSVTGSWTPVSDQGSKVFVFNLDTALEAKTKYRVKFLGDPDLNDNNNLANKKGIRTVRGTVAEFDSNPSSGPLTFSFTTGDQVCGVNVIEVSDDSEEHPLLYLENEEVHPFHATAKSVQNGKIIPISPVSEYKWEWKPWSTSASTTIFVAKPFPDDKTKSNIQADNKNGTAFVTAMLEVTQDTINDPSEETKSVHGTAPVTVILCENPWPNLSDEPIAPFRDKEPTGDGKDSSLKGTIFDNGVYFNFLTTYCRDAGEFGPEDDIPSLKIAYVPTTTVTLAEGIMREYLFTYGDDRPDLKKDGIGIRIASNPLHYSPEEWYKWRGFGGTPTSFIIDGYQAIQDETTLYVAAANTEGPGQSIYSNIYLISHNPDASETTLNIFDQMVKNLAFNINLSQGVGNVCEKDNDPNTEPKNPYLEGIEEPVSCSTDFDCINALGTDKTHCGSYKLKLARDTVRVADFAKMSRALEEAKARDGFYPKLTAGTFLPTFSNSRWPSWDEEYQLAVGGDAPKDPVNQFLTCGRCSESKAVCGVDGDCPDGQTCGGYSIDKGLEVPAASTEPLTCYDTDMRTFLCSKLISSPSRFYQYRSINNGQRYELSAEFEVPEPSDQNAKWWSPALTKEIKRCINPETQGFMCDQDSDCRFCPDPKSPTCLETVIPGACKVVGGKFVYQDVCENQFYGLSGTCGDGVIGPACLGGTNDGNPCSKDSDCPGDKASCTASEKCELGQTQITSCDYDPKAPGEEGLKVQVCSDCKEWVDDPNISKCDLGAMCGNGRIDYVCFGGVRNNLGCDSDDQCKGNGGNIPDGACVKSGETCDDGQLNGTYGHCNLTCNGYAAYCGDKLISPGEVCDNGGANGEYCGKNCNVNQSCSLDCKGKAPYCGDNIITTPEECDGQSETTELAICKSGTGKDKPCSSNEDCGENGVCAVSPDVLQPCAEIKIDKCVTSLKQCVTLNYSSTNHKPSDYKICQSSLDCVGEPGGKTQCRSVQDFVTKCTGDDQCSLGGITGSCVSFPTAHVRTCSETSCSFEDLENQTTSWSACKVIGFCGDGIIQEPAEACDNGKDNGDTKACTSECKKNVCGDGKPYINVEECDNGGDNGKVTCSADYSSTCNSCSIQCKFVASSGGFCGDQIKNGPEQCDGTVVADNIPDQFDPCPYSGKLEFLCEYLNADCMQSPCLITKEDNITCPSLGYDFSNNGAAPRMVALDPKMKETVNVPCTELAGKKRYEVEMLNNCAGVYCFVDQDKLSKHHMVYPDNPISAADFWKCVREKGSEEGVGIVTGKDPEIVTCNKSCTFNGCGRCSDEAGLGVIEGQIVDAVYNQVVPFARVSMFYKGVLVKQVATDGDGKYKLTGLNDRAECSQYKLVIDKYNDNPCTGKDNRPSCGGAFYPKWTVQVEVDEGKRGGYWPHTTPLFSVSNFNEKTSQQKDGRIFIFPRPGAGEAYYSVFWKVPWKTPGMDPNNLDLQAIWGGNANHLVLPTGYTVANVNDINYCNSGVNVGKGCSSRVDCPLNSPKLKNSYCSNGYCYETVSDYVSQDSKNCSSDQECKDRYKDDKNIIKTWCKQGVTETKVCWMQYAEYTFETTDVCNNNNECQDARFAQCIPNPKFPQDYTASICSYDERPGEIHQCARDITWSNVLKGQSNLNKFPYAQTICLHNAGDKVGGYGPLMSFYNGCPVEGKEDCLKRLGPKLTLAEYAFCQQGIQTDITISSCVGGSDSGKNCTKNSDCTSGFCWSTCDKTFWDTCDFYTSGPLTTYFRYSPYGNQNQPIRMLWGLWDSKSTYTKSIYPEFNDTKNLLETHLKLTGVGKYSVGQGYSAVVSTNSKLFEIDAKDLKSACGDPNSPKDCKFWHIADLNPKDGAVKLQNVLREGRKDETVGTASYEWSFQGVHWWDVNPKDQKNDIKYCVKNNALYFAPFWDNQLQQFIYDNSCSKIGGTWQNVTYKAWSQANF